MRRWPLRVTAVLAAAAVLVVACPHPVAANSFEEDQPDESGLAAVVPSIAPTSFSGQIGLAAVLRGSRSPDARSRAAALQRAAQIGGDDAWKLVEAGAGDALGDDPDAALRVRLVAARLLARDPRRTSAMAALRPLLLSPVPTLRPTPVPMMGPMGMGPMGPMGPMPWSAPLGVKRAPDGERVRLVRVTAALALARQGDFDTLLARARTRDDLEAQSAALQALLAVPPPSLSSTLTKAEGNVSRETVELLARLDDLRAADVLLRVARGKDDVAAAHAMLALARMGDGRVVAVARQVDAEADASLRIAGAETLAMLGESGAAAAISALLPNKKTELEGRRLAIAYPTEALLTVLVARAKAGDGPAIAALGRVGGPAIEALGRLAQDDAAPSADAATYALATIPDSAADRALDGLLEGSPALRRRVVRGAAARAARIGGASATVRGAAKAMLGSKLDVDRSAGAVLLAVIDRSEAERLSASDDRVVRRAAVVALAAHPVSAAAAIARERLAAGSGADDPDLARALAAIAVRAVDGTPEHDVAISTSTLATWLAEDGDASALAAFLLAARGGDAAAPHVARALGSDDLAVRVGALLGLAVSPEPGAAGAIASDYPDLVLPELRRAAIRALVARGAAGSKATLALAAELDPDVETRALATSAVTFANAAPRSPLLAGREAIQAKIVGATKGGIAGVLVRADGLAVPVLADPDGVVLAFGLPAGRARLDLRPASSKEANTP